MPLIKNGMSIEDFIKREELKMNWLDKAFMNYPEMFSTKELAVTVKKLFPGKEKIIKPSILHKIFPTTFLLFSIGCWLILFNMLIHKIIIPVTTCALLFVSFIICINIWYTFINRKYNYKIRLSDAQLNIDKNIISWNEISDTQIMRVKVGRGINSFLIIFKTDGEVFKYSLFNFGISDEKLAAYIEFYKTRQIQ